MTPGGATLTGVDSAALVVVRAGRLPAGAEEAVVEAGGAVVLVGPGALAAAENCPEHWGPVWCAEAETDSILEAVTADVAPAALLILPGSPDGRDLAPRLAAALARPLLPGAVRAEVTAGGHVRADLLRADGRVVVPATVTGPAVVTLWPGSGSRFHPAGPGPAGPGGGSSTFRPDPRQGDVGSAHPSSAGTTGPDPLAGKVRILELVEPDPATMDLAEARRVFGGGAGLVPSGADDRLAGAVFALLAEVAAAVGASAGATRVVTDAGWMGYDRQIGTTGVTVHPEVYVALGVSGASQHTGGLGGPSTVVSVNLDPSCPMTAMADLGVVADALGVLVAMADLLGLGVDPEVAALAAGGTDTGADAPAALVTSPPGLATSEAL
jgi:electron transfer flavoprotein alpha subunit